MGNFPKALTHHFGQKFQLSSLFVFIENFPKGLTHDFGQKFKLSSWFVFIQNRPRNDVWECSR